MKLTRRTLLLGAGAAALIRPVGSQSTCFPVGGGGIGATRAAEARLYLIGGPTGSGPVCISAPPSPADRKLGSVYLVHDLGVRRWNGSEWERLT
mgnify:CR=1 FL=1